MLGGPGIINGQITMNGLGNALAAVDDGVRRLSQSMDALSAALQAVKAELDQVSARVQNIERQVTPQSLVEKTQQHERIVIQQK